jgi:putative oxidoreductase
MGGNEMNLHIGILVIRLIIGITFIAHGLQKLAGWFGGNGINGTAQFFSSLGIDFPLFVATVVGGFEMIGGLLLVFGILTPIAGIMLSGVMVGAIIKVHGQNGFWVSDHGFEYNLVLATVSIAVGLIGPGKYTLNWVKKNFGNTKA